MRKTIRKKHYKSYANALNRSKKLIKRLSDYTNVKNKKSLIKLIKDIKYKYFLDIDTPKNIYEAIDIAEDLFYNNELKAKLSKKISWSGSPIEKKMAEYLDGAGIEYYREYHIGKYRVDFMIPSKKLVIECQGYAWHQGPRTYQEMEKELIRMNTIAKAGYRILYYSGRQIYSNRNKILKDISLF